MLPRSIESPYLFEISTEVANKVGGINTVIKSKVPVTVNEFGEDSYFLIGLYKASTAMIEFEDVQCMNSCLDATIKALRDQGIVIRFGRWLIEGHPYVILIDILSALHKLDEWKADLYNLFAIPSGCNDFEMNDCILFGYLVAWLLSDFDHQLRNAITDQQQCNDPKAMAPQCDDSPTSVDRPSKDFKAADKKATKIFNIAHGNHMENDSRSYPRAILAHFHEWLAGVGLVLLRKRCPAIATLFTTHATLLGRFLCAGDVDFYNTLHTINVDEESGKRGIYHRYCLERAAANMAHVFTTVSHITAFEAEHLLKRRPDGVLPNGLNVKKFSAMHEFQNLHAKSKAKIHEFIQGHFYGHHQDLNLDNTVYFFIAGRYEFRNKGVDLFLESLARLNYRLKHVNSGITVVAFIIMPAANRGYTVETLKGHAAIKKLQESVSDLEGRIGARIFEAILK